MTFGSSPKSGFQPTSPEPTALKAVVRQSQQLSVIVWVNAVIVTWPVMQSQQLVELLPDPQRHRVISDLVTLRIEVFQALNRSRELFVKVLILA